MRMYLVLRFVNRVFPPTYNLHLIRKLVRLLALALPFTATAQQFDIVIRNGHIIDGTGSPWYAGDVAILNGRVAAMGSLANVRARRIIDAHGLTVTPGFIDMLGQSELSMLVNPHVPSKIFQGITTEITGEGSSIAPILRITMSILTGRRSPNTSPGSKDKAWVLTWQVMWALPRFAAWCWAMIIVLRVRPSWSK
jgi:hypothetical protein